MVYIIAAIFIFGVLIAVHELGHFLAAKACGVRVNEFSIGMGPALFHRQKGETEYAIRILPIGGYCAMDGEDEESDDPRSLTKQSLWKKLLIFAAGALMNFLTGFLLILILYSGTSTFSTTQVAGFAPEFDQTASALQTGDVLWSINGERVYLFSDIDLLLNLGGGQEAELVVVRDGEKVDLGKVSLPYQTYTGTNGQAYNGYGIYVVGESSNVLRVVKYSWLNAVDFVRLVRLSLQMLLTGGASIQDLSGPVGIVSTITQVGKESETVAIAVQNIVYFAALIAVNLAVMNLLPLPALDGGKIFFLLLDAVTLALFKRKIPDKYENYVHTAGFLLLMGLMLVVTFTDISKLIR